MKKRTNNVQSAYITTFRAYALNAVTCTAMLDNLRKSIKQAIYEIELPLYEVIKCSKRQAWEKFCSRLVSAVNTITDNTNDILRIIRTLELKLAKETK